MKRILSGVLVLSVCLTPVAVPLMIQPSWAESQALEDEDPYKFIDEFKQQLSNQPTQYIESFKQLLGTAKMLGDRALEARTLTNIGTLYSDIGQPQQALYYYNKALLIIKKEIDKNIEAVTLNNIGAVYLEIEKPKQALVFFQQSLLLRRLVDDRPGETTTLSNIGSAYHKMGELEKAFEYFEEALIIKTRIGDLSGQANILNTIGVIFIELEKPLIALVFFDKALSTSKTKRDWSLEAATLNNIASIYKEIGQLERALEFYKQSLLIVRKTNNRSSEAVLLSNIGSAYYHMGQYNAASDSWEQSILISLQIRGSLKRENRQDFLHSGVHGGSVISFTNLLIDQNQPERAYEWINRVETAELADYTRLINATVSNNPEAQEAVNQWNQRYQQIQFLYRQLDNNPSEQTSKQITALWEENNKLAEEIANKYPEVAELFETTPTDIQKLRANIPLGTVVIHPVLLTGVKNVSDSIAIFVLTKDKLSILKKSINASEFNQLLQDYRTSLEAQQADFNVNSAKLYDILIRPVEDTIKAASPTQLSIIATDKLRYIPFETLCDSQSELPCDREKGSKYLIEKYPINYLTRISSSKIRQPQKFLSLEKIAFFPSIIAVVVMGGFFIWMWRKFGLISSGILVILSGGAAFLLLNSQNLQILALGNPQPTQVNLPGTEAEANSITQIFPGSAAYLGMNATLKTFKDNAPRFSFLHLGTHGCFDPAGCPNLGMEPNTILFANNQQYKIADAALLGLQNTQLITLSACQTAKEANANGEEISGLAYIFERAGAKAVIASLWNAEDNSSRDLMIQFYQNLKQGMSKAEAMRQAKLAQVDRHPWFWSPFILIGDSQ